MENIDFGILFQGIGTMIESRLVPCLCAFRFLIPFNF